MGKIFDFFRSSYRISVDECDGTPLLDFLVSRDIPFYGLETGDCKLSLGLYSPYFREYKRARGDARFAGEVRTRMGLLALAHRYRARLGLVIGGALALALLATSSLFVWDVRVTGSDRIPAEVVIEALERHGVTLGAYIPSLDTEKIEQAMILEVDGLSWISLNLRGTVASVEVRERAANTETVDTQAPSNLIAAFDGQIEAIEITGGVSAVKRGQIVKKGDLLASGVIDSNALGYRLVRARGNITARVTLTYEAEIPYQIQEKVYTGVFIRQKSVKIFGKTIKLFGKDSISTENCDRIEKERRLYLFGKIKLPIFITETTLAEYEMKDKTLTETEALKLAYEELRVQSEEELADAEILARHTQLSMDENGIRLTEQVECILDITEEVKIETN